MEQNWRGKYAKANAANTANTAIRTNEHDCPPPGSKGSFGENQGDLGRTPENGGEYGEPNGDCGDCGEQV